jgi:hypothetical protein
MVVWVLRRIYCCILLNVIMMNGCMSIMTDLPLYFINVIMMNGCMIIMKDVLLYFIECNCDEWLYKYYERSTVVFYWM